MNTAIIVAAGQSTRFGGNVPKQFLELAGKPVVIHTMLKFEACPAVDEIILVLPPAHTELFRETAQNFPLTKLTSIVAGGENRAESVLNGLRAVRPETAGIIAVHDGARPLVRSDEIAAAIAKAEETGAAVLTAPVTDTIKRVSGEKITGTIDRGELRRALTPQCFRYQTLNRAYETAGELSAATDESFLVERAGFPVAYIDGNAMNFKITNAEDLALAEFLLRSASRRLSAGRPARRS